MLSWFIFFDKSKNSLNFVNNYYRKLRYFLGGGKMKTRRGSKEKVSWRHLQTLIHKLFKSKAFQATKPHQMLSEINRVESLQLAFVKAYFCDTTKPDFDIKDFSYNANEASWK